MIDLPDPLAVAHKSAGFRFTWRQLSRFEVTEMAPSYLLFLNILSFFSDTLQIHTKGILLGRATDSTVPPVIMPRDSDV
jgi:hypothetical protein